MNNASHSIDRWAKNITDNLSEQTWTAKIQEKIFNLTCNQGTVYLNNTKTPIIFYTNHIGENKTKQNKK